MDTSRVETDGLRHVQQVLPPSPGWRLINRRRRVSGQAPPAQTEEGSRATAAPVELSSCLSGPASIRLATCLPCLPALPTPPEPLPRPRHHTSTAAQCAAASPKPQPQLTVAPAQQPQPSTGWGEAGWLLLPSDSAPLRFHPSARHSRGVPCRAVLTPILQGVLPSFPGSLLAGAAGRAGLRSQPAAGPPELGDKEVMVSV